MLRSMNNAVLHLPMGNAEHATQYPYGGTVIADGDAEAAGVGSWITAGSVTKESGGRPGSGGLQVIRVADVGGVNGAARQNVLVTGRIYQVWGWARSNGTGIPRVVNNGTAFWVGTTATDWQFFDNVITAADTDFRLWCLENDQYVEFDDVFVIELRPQILDVSGSGLNATFGEDGLTAGEFPTKLTTSVGYSFDGDYFNCGTDSRLAFSDKMTLMVVCSSDRTYPSDDGTIRYRGLCGRAKGDSAPDVGILLNWYGDNTTRTLRFRLANGMSGINTQVNNFDMRPGEIRTIAAVADGSYMRLFADGEEISNDIQTLSAQTPTDEYFVVGSRFNTISYCWDGNIYEFAAFNYALPATEIREYYYDVLRRLRNRL